jgi:hypothetical protein
MNRLMERPVQANHSIIKRFRDKSSLLWGLVFGIVFGFLLQKGGVTKYDVIVGQLLLCYHR